MKLNIKSQAQHLIDTLRKVQPVLKKDWETLVKKGARLALQKAVDLTPPSSQGEGPTKATQRRAEAIIRGDVRRVYASVDYAYSTIPSPAAASAFWFLTHGKGKNKHSADSLKSASDVLRDNGNNTRIRNAPIVPSIDPSLAEKDRKRGRVPRNNVIKQIALKDAEIKAIIKGKWQRIGWLAAGWLADSDKLGKIKAPAWIKRHKGKAKGAVVIRISGGVVLIDIINRVAYGPEAQLARIIPYALRAASIGLSKEAKHVAAKAMKKAGLRTS